MTKHISSHAGYCCGFIILSSATVIRKQWTPRNFWSTGTRSWFSAGPIRTCKCWCQATRNQHGQLSSPCVWQLIYLPNFQSNTFTVTHKVTVTRNTTQHRNCKAKNSLKARAALRGTGASSCWVGEDVLVEINPHTLIFCRKMEPGATFSRRSENNSGVDSELLRASLWFRAMCVFRWKATPPHAGSVFSCRFALLGRSCPLPAALNPNNQTDSRWKTTKHTSVPFLVLSWPTFSLIGFAAAGRQNHCITHFSLCCLAYFLLRCSRPCSRRSSSSRALRTRGKSQVSLS